MNARRMQQTDLFGEAVPDWGEHWQGMPEYRQVKVRPYAQIMVRFRCQADLDDFCLRIGQTLNPNSQCTWHPELPPIGGELDERWRDE